jgi:RNA polymerase sigma-70 factor (ECF subfamily)
MNHWPDASSSDVDLVRAIRRDRSESAMNVLYDRHTPRAFQTAWRILGGDIHRAEDAIQEAWMRALAGMDAWSTTEPFGTWLRGITAHIAIDWLRRDRRLVFTPDLDECAETISEHIDLESAVAALSPGYRSVLVLHDIEGFTHAEIAARLGIAVGTSKASLFKARRAVRARLRPEHCGEELNDYS